MLEQAIRKATIPHPKLLVAVNHDRALAEEIRENIARLPYTTAAIVATRRDVLEQGEQVQPDLLLIKPRLEEGLDGVDAAVQLRMRLGMPVVFIEDPADEEALKAAIDAEPFGFVPRRAQGKELQALLTVILQRLRVWRELQIRNRQQQATARLGQEALVGQDLQGLMGQAVALVSETLRNELCKVLELLPGGGELLLKAGVGWRPGLLGRATVGAGTHSQAGYTLLSEEPVIVEDLGAETRFSSGSLLNDHGVISGMSVIIQTRDGPYGVLGTHTTQRRIFSRDDVNFLQAVANVLGMAIDRWRSERVIREVSTPVLPIGDRLLLIPLIGTLDTQRVQQLRQRLLSAVRQHRAHVVVLDLTGIAEINTQVAGSLEATVQAAKLLGARVVVSGISAGVSRILVEMDAMFLKETLVTDLRSAVELTRANHLRTS